MFGGGWMIVNGGRGGAAGDPGPSGGKRVAGPPRAVGREDVGGEPSLVDPAFDIVRRIGLRQSRHRGLPGNRTTRSSSGRTGRGTPCWFGVRGRFGHPEPPCPAPSRRSIGRLPSRLPTDPPLG